MEEGYEHQKTASVKAGVSKAGGWHPGQAFDLSAYRKPGHERDAVFSPEFAEKELGFSVAWPCPPFLKAGAMCLYWVPCIGKVAHWARGIQPRARRSMALFEKILHRDWKDRLLVLEALGWLSVAKVAVHTVPFRHLSRTLGRSEAQTAPGIAPAERVVAVKISWAVQAAARHVPFGFVCLPQAIAAQRMLRRRAVANTLYFGVTLKPDGQQTMLAHAWLRAGDKIVTGEHREGAYAVVATFADDACAIRGTRGAS